LSLGIVVAVFPVIFVGELPDKTMFASLVMSSRGRPLAVWVGAAAAFVIHVAIAVTVGVAIFRLLPASAVDGVVAALFAGGAVYAYLESRRPDAARQLHTLGSHRRVAVTAFVVVFIAEWGDLTQLLTANLAAHYQSGLSVAVGALLALWAVAALAVVSGQSLLRLFPVRVVRLVTAVVLAVLAVVAAVAAVWG